MSETEATATETATTEGGDGFQAITSQAELNKIIGDRLGREREKFSDYDDLKAKASRLAEIEDANKSELEKLTERLTAAERRAAEAAEEVSKADLRALKSDVARVKGVPAGSLTGSTKEELEAAAEELIRWRDGSKPSVPKGPLRSGAGRTEGGTSPRELAVRVLRGS